MGIFDNSNLQALLSYATYEVIKQKDKWFWHFGQPVLTLNIRMDQNNLFSSSVIVSKIHHRLNHGKDAYSQGDISLIKLLLLVVSRFLWHSQPSSKPK
jgi:hypothetical protein